MSRQSLESIQSDFDRIALLPTETWNHNVHYHDYLLSQIPKQCSQVLEVGCGTGEFSRLLAQRAQRVLAIDLSPEMIRVARVRSRKHANIDFVIADVMTAHLPDDYFECIATLTTMHHLPAESFFQKMRKALKRGGVFVCLDLYRRSRVTDFLVDGVAYPASLCLRTFKTGKPRQSREVREAYAEHEKSDAYLTLAEIQQTCSGILAGALVKRHLFWRYSITWKKCEEIGTLG